MHDLSKWIWPQATVQADQYAEFYELFSYTGQDIRLLLSADSNYAVYVNGIWADSGQYPDFPTYKIYDELNLTPYCREGRNHLAIVVWHYGVSNMSYFPGQAALRFELWQGETLLAHSGAHTRSRISTAYRNGYQKTITSQLGFSFCYDMNQEDGWMQGRLCAFEESKVVEQELPLFPRPIKKCQVDPPAPAQYIQSQQDTHFLFDLGREEVGYLTLRIHSPKTQKLLIAYGEHIVDGGVRRHIAQRDFSVEVILRPGINEYLNPFRRLGCRYLEAWAEEAIEIEQLTLRPVFYPLTLPDRSLPTPLQQQIYDVSVRTLHLCMHDHYEDTPWREQALYAMDSRNQMLCGYEAFAEYEFPRANLLLISKDQRPDGLLSICTPSANDLTIPSFSLHYFQAVLEYTKASQDLSLLREIYPKLLSILQAFQRHMEGDCLPIFQEKCHWNFYEWSKGLGGALHQSDEKRYDAALNCLFSLALQAMDEMARLIGAPERCLDLARRVNIAIQEKFFDSKRGLFVNSTEDPEASELVNALALLCGAAPDDGALADRLAHPSEPLTPATLSMVCFKYDALLKVDTERYAPFVLQDIEEKYSAMLRQGATTFWETEEGEKDFGSAGSLCHGWSAMPVYYYHRLLK